MLSGGVARFSSDDNATSYVLPVLWMKSRLPIMGQAEAMHIGCVLKVTHQGAEQGVKSDIYDWLVPTNELSMFVIFVGWKGRHVAIVHAMLSLTVTSDTLLVEVMFSLTSVCLSVCLFLAE